MGRKYQKEKRYSVIKGVVMGDSPISGSKRKTAYVLSGGGTELAARTQQGIRDVGIKSGVHTPTSEKKQAANEKIAADKASVAAEAKKQKLKDEDIRRRTAIFQSVGGSVAVGGRKAIYSN